MIMSPVSRNQCRSLFSRSQSVRHSLSLVYNYIHRWALGAFGGILGNLLLGTFGQCCMACPPGDPAFLSINEFWIWKLSQVQKPGKKLSHFIGLATHHLLIIQPDFLCTNSRTLAHCPSILPLDMLLSLNHLDNSLWVRLTWWSLQPHY